MTVGELLEYAVFCAVGFVVLLRVVSWYLRPYQDKLLYFPHQPEKSTVDVPNPSGWGLTCWEELRIVTEDKVVLHGYFIKQEKDWDKAVTILYFHGNAGNIGHRIPLAVSMHRNAHCNIVMVEYRGYGLSSGIPSEAGLKRDAKAALTYVASLAINRRAIVVMGTSLGGAVAIHLAATASIPIAGVIVENTFTSISKMVDVLWASFFRPPGRPLVNHVLTPVFLHFLKPLVLQIDWDSRRAIGAIAVPILFLSGKKDELIPPSQMHELYVSANKSPRKLFVSLPTGTHNDTWCCERYFEAIASFLEHNVLQSANPRVPPFESNHAADPTLV